MSDNTVDLSQGGLVAITLGPHQTSIPVKYIGHPQVVGIPTEGPSVNLQKRLLPENTKCVILTEGLSRVAGQVLHAEIRNQRLVYLVRKTGDAIIATLDSMFKAAVNGYVSQIPTVQAPRGALKEFVAKHIQVGGSTSVEARRLLEIAQHEGLSTTFGSLSQAISVYKRQNGLGETPKSALAPSLLALATLDEAITHLTDLRAYVEQTEAENTRLKTRLAAIEKAVQV